LADFIGRQNWPTSSINPLGEHLTEPNNEPTLWKAHDGEYPIELIVVVWVVGFDVLLPAQKNWL